MTGQNDKNHGKKPAIKVPKIYWNFTRREVLTMEWIDGIKLTDSEQISNACLDKKHLIDQVISRCNSFVIITELI